MANEMKSKFRERKKYFQRLFLLRKRKGFPINNLNDEFDNIEKNNRKDKAVVKRVVVKKGNKSEKVVKIKYRKKRKVGIDLNANRFNSDIPVADEFKTNDHCDELRSVVNLKNNKIINKNLVVKNNKKECIDVNSNSYNFDDNSFNNVSRELLLNDILSLLNKKNNSILFELDNLYSNYFCMANYSNDEVFKEECEKKLLEIKKIKDQIKSLEEEFDYIINNKYLDIIVDLDDSSLSDKIIKYRTLCSNISEKKELYEKYKKIDDFEKINNYLNIFSKKIEKIKIDKEHKKDELESRDKDFILFKKNVSSVNIKNDQYYLIINSQVDICNKLLKDVDKIYKTENVYNKVVGISDFISSSFKYLFYLSLSPFKKIIPSIAMNTLAARSMINVARNNLRTETVRKINYYAKDYEYELNKYLYDIDNLDKLLYLTIDDINSFREEFSEKFYKYKNEIPEYRDTINKINKIEKMVNFNIKRVKNIRNKIIKGKEKNKEKLDKIKVLKKDI